MNEEMRFHLDKDKVNKAIELLNLSNKELKYANSKMTELEQNLNIGNIQPAIVYTTHPLQIACYTEDFDNIFMLEFPKEYVSMYDLHEGDHLLTSTVFYKVKMTKYDDILPGFLASDVFKDATPMILKFLVSDIDLENCNTKFSDFLWEYTLNKAHAYMVFSEGKVRDGFFYFFKGGIRG